MKFSFITLLAITCLIACKDFVELDAPKTQIVKDAVFVDDAGARAAIAGIYAQIMGSASFASGGADGVAAIAGLSADELYNHSLSQGRVAIYNNSLTPANTVSSVWNKAYLTIYEANAILEGIAKSTGISKPVRDQVIGEALFIRAFEYFYLINFYGDVPLLTSTDYRVNRVASRAPMSEVYAQIESDLKEAQALLLEDYSFSQGEKVKPNKSAATALLARVYLYQENWAAAAAQASVIIDSHQFSLVDDLNGVFLANSEEAIWQLMPAIPGYNTYDGPYFIIVSNPTETSLTSGVINAFEPGDDRPSAWIGAYTGSDDYYYVNKYKIRLRDSPLEEYQMVFRLAEQYLIRAEARAMENELSASIDDVNMIRMRAGLNVIDATGLTQQQALEAIEQERRVELFVEWGHRWFDLKRSGKIDAVLGPMKPDWQSKDALFPIPQSEINANPNLIQNP